MNQHRPHLLGLLAGLFLAAGLVLSAMVVTRGWLKIVESQSITVTGSAKRAVVSDLVIWNGSFVTEASDLHAAQVALKASQAKVAAFLAKWAMTNATYSPIRIEELRATLKGVDGYVQSRTSGYRLMQSVTVKSADIPTMQAVDAASTALVEEGVLFTPSAPEFIYTKAGEAKVEMLAEATRDARARADQIAHQGEARVAHLRSARMGVFQITPEHSAVTSWEGVSDTTSLNKTITAVVTATFSLQ